MGLLPGRRLFVASMTGGASFGEMGVRIDELPVNHIAFVLRLRRYRRRGPRSPDSFRDLDLHRAVKAFEYLFVRMTTNAPAFNGIQRVKEPGACENSKGKCDRGRRNQNAGEVFFHERS